GTVDVLLMYRPSQLLNTPYYGTLFLSSLRRNNGTAHRAEVWTLPAMSKKTAQQIRELVDGYPAPLRIFTDSVDVVESVNSVKNPDPAARIEVVFLDVTAGG